VGLRARFTLWFSLAALVTIAVAAVVTREVVSQSFRNDFERSHAAARRAAQREVDALVAEVEQAVRVLADNNHDIAGILFELETQGNLRWDIREQLKQREQGIMRGVRLDLMFLIDDRGAILSAPHSGAGGEIDRHWVKRAQRRPGQGYFARQPVLVAGEVRNPLMALAARTVQGNGRALTVVGGSIVKPGMLARIRREGRVEVRVAAAGAVLLGSADPRTWQSARVDRIPLPAAEGPALASLDLAISDADLQALLANVTWASIAVAAAALVAASLLGFAVARGMTRGLHDLVEGVQAAARGDLDHRVPARQVDEIGAVAGAVNDMMRDLKDANERLAAAQRIAAWQEIARRLAHEIKNPLTPIQMSVETMRKTQASQHPSFAEIFAESTQTILEEVGRLKRIVGEFSEFARMPKPRRAACDLNEVVSVGIGLYKGVDPIEAQLAADLPVIAADRDQLSQVLLNLIENARDAVRLTAGSGQDARIVVATRIGPGRRTVELLVEDNGPGVAPEVRDKLFTPYFTTKHGAGGTGLGLAIAHRIVSDHGGKIRALSSLLGGACFAVELPAEVVDDAGASGSRLTG
jgi:two-component system, NtrC family, nitrogen regulation sensor histidine kinase NtrY